MLWRYFGRFLSYILFEEKSKKGDPNVNKKEGYWNETL